MNVNLLRHVRTIVTHDNCADGIASALILHTALPAVIPSTTLTSDVCELVDADLVAGFAYGADEGGQRVRLSWSLRSRAGVDVSAIAARHGGGGHTAAAGFSVHDDGRSPYVRASELLRV